MTFPSARPGKRHARQWVGRSRTAAIFAVVVAVGLAATTQSGVGASPIGNRLGIASFATMHRAYLHTPGVEMTVVSRGSTRAVFGHFLFELRPPTAEVP